MKIKSKLGKVLEYLINEDEGKARDLLHQVFVEKARAIHDELISEDEDDVLEHDVNPDELSDEVDYEEMYSDDSEDDLHEEEDKDESDMDSEDSASEEDMDSADDEDLGDEESDEDSETDAEEEESDEEMSLEDKIEDLEAKLDMLKDEFEELQGVEEKEHDIDFNHDGKIGPDGEADEVDSNEADLEEMENYTDELYNANRKLVNTGAAGQNEVGDDPRRVMPVDETGPAAPGNANKPAGSTTDMGAHKGSSMNTDANYPSGEGEGTFGDADDTDAGANDAKYAGWPGKAMSTESIEEMFDALDESVLDELERVNVKMGGETGEGKFAGSEYNTNSPLTQRKVGHREEGERRLTSVKSEHDGFNREDTPVVKKADVKARKGNVRNKATDELSYKEKAGDKSAMLNSDEGFGNPQVVSPIGSKSTGGNKGSAEKI